MANDAARGDRWTVLSGWLRTVRAQTPGRLVAVVRLGAGDGTDAAGDAALIAAVEPLAQVVVLTGADPDRLDAARARFARPGRVRVEPDDWAAVAAAREATGPGDRLVAVSGTAGVLWDAMRTPLGVARRTA
jgi:hypothetical protein